MSAKVEMNLNAVGIGTLILNGVDISSLCGGVEVSSFPGQATKVTLHINAALLKDIDLKAGMLVIKGVDLPEVMELALWRHLAERYGNKPDDIEITNMTSMVREYVPR